MIAFVEGKIEEVSFSNIIVEVGGIGYYIRTPGNVYGQIKEGEIHRIHTHQNVREDDISLYGFVNKEDKELFQLLIQVSGIGPKVAINIVGSAPSNKLYEAILYEDMAFLTKLPGVGKKTAQRIILDLKDKVKEIYTATNSSEGAVIELDSSFSTRYNMPTVMRDVIDALESLGYTAKEAEFALQEINKLHSEKDRQDWTVDIYIRQSLQRLMKGK